MPRGFQDPRGIVRELPPIPYAGGMVDPVILVVYALAVARVTGLVTTDDITEDLRHRFIGWLDDRPKTLGSFIASLITCPWCAGVWISFAAAPVVFLWGDYPVFLVPALALALAQFVGMTSSLGR